MLYGTAFCGPPAESVCKQAMNRSLATCSIDWGCPLQGLLLHWGWPGKVQRKAVSVQLHYSTIVLGSAWRCVALSVVRSR